MSEKSKVKEEKSCNASCELYPCKLVAIGDVCALDKPKDKAIKSCGIRAEGMDIIAKPEQDKNGKWFIRLYFENKYRHTKEIAEEICRRINYFNGEVNDMANKKGRIPKGNNCDTQTNTTDWQCCDKLVGFMRKRKYYCLKYGKAIHIIKMTNGFRWWRKCPACLKRSVSNAR